MLDRDGNWLPATGFRQLASSNWLPATGFQQLASGNWLPTTECCESVPSRSIRILCQQKKRPDEQSSPGRLMLTSEGFSVFTVSLN
jgi:hypothetical protein